MGKQAPPQGNFTGAAQSDLNANRPTQNTPYGSVSWERGAPTMSFEEWAAANPVTNRPQGMTDEIAQAIQRDAYNRWSAGEGRSWEQNTTLDPRLQAALDAQMALQTDRSQFAGGLMDQARDAMGRPMSYEGLPDLPSGEEARRRGFDAAYRLGSSRLDPYWAQRRESNEARLLNQGFTRGGQGWDRALDELGRQENDAYGGLTDRATLLGEQMAQGEFQRGLGARQQGLTERYQQRYEPLNTMNALLAGQQVGMPQFPGFAQSNQLGAAGAQYQADLNRYNAQGAQGDQLWQLLGAGIGGYFGGPMGAAAGARAGSAV